MSQRNDIRDYLLIEGNSLTALEALERFGCMRLGARILELKKKGWEISSEMVKVGGKGKSVARYIMIGDKSVPEIADVIPEVAGLIPVHFMSERDIKELSCPDLDMTEETEIEDNRCIMQGAPAYPVGRQGMLL